MRRQLAEWWNGMGCFVIIVVLVVAVVGAMYFLSRVGREPADAYAEVPAGATVIYAETSSGEGFYGTRIVMLETGCAIVQETSGFGWHLSESRSGALGGTNGITNAWCAPPE